MDEPYPPQLDVCGWCNQGWDAHVLQDGLFPCPILDKSIDIGNTTDVTSVD
jgi:hypothetical protein